MGHYYQDLDKAAYDYDLVEYDGLGHKKYRGPAVDTSKPYIACIGAAQTYGRFCNTPYPHIMAEKLNIQVMNLGVGGAGPEHFNTTQYLDYLNGAELVVLQVLAGRSAGNSLFNNREHGGLLGVRLSDYKKMRFEQFLEELFEEGDHDKIVRILKETRDDYVSTYLDLLRKIHAPKMLFWFSDRTPDYEDNFSDPYGLLNRYPQLINRTVFENLRVMCDTSVEFCTNVGLPQKLFAGKEDIDGAKVKDGFLYNTYYPSPEMHEQSAEMLVESAKPFVASGVSKSNISKPKPDFTPFVLLAAERTGSNLLAGQLDSHHACLCGNEIFNDFYLDKAEIPMLSKEHKRFKHDAELIELRKNDPCAFVERYYEMARQAGYKSAGFKLQYGQAEKFPDLINHLISDPAVSIFHLTRRNLLRRYVSEVKANLTNKWAVGVDEDAPPEPVFALKMESCIWDILNKEETREKYELQLNGRDKTLAVFYENLADRSALVGARACRFLGLPKDQDLEVRFKKTSQRSIGGEVTNYGELRGQFYRWLNYFDD